MHNDNHNYTIAECMAIAAHTHTDSLLNQSTHGDTCIILYHAVFMIFKWQKRAPHKGRWSQWFREQSKVYSAFFGVIMWNQWFAWCFFPAIFKCWGWHWSCRDIVMLMRESSNLSGSVQRAILSLASAERSVKSRCVALFIFY